MRLALACTRPPQGELDYLTLNTWTLFLEECELVDNKSEYCKKGMLDTLFIEIDGAGKRQLGDRQKALSRPEFMAALVRLAIDRHVRTGEVASVHSALRLLLQRVAERVDPKLIAPPNAFRRRVCYTEEVSDVLKRNEPSLRSLFGGLAMACERRQKLLGGRGTLIDLGTFMGWLRRLGMLGPDLGERAALLAFGWSRMAVRDASTDKGARKESHLPFEGWLEALCHLGALKALPTDDEIEEAGDKHAGAHTARLRDEQGKEFQRALARGATKWGDDPGQPFHRALAHCLAIITHSIGQSLGGGSGSGGGTGTGGGGGGGGGGTGGGRGGSGPGLPVRFQQSDATEERKLVLRWRRLPFEPKAGVEVHSEALCHALADGQLEFTRSEMEACAVAGSLQSDSFVFVEGALLPWADPDRATGGCYYRPSTQPAHDAPVITKVEVDRWVESVRLDR